MDNESFTQSIKNTTVCVVGLGLIGGSLVKAFSSLPFRRITVCDRDERVIALALSETAAAEGFTTPAPLLNDADLVFLCAYPAANAQIMRDNAGAFKDGVLITDVSGVKSAFARQVNIALPKGARVVLGHPMAGKERGGYEMSDAAIFKNAGYIVIPTESSTTEDVEFIKELARAIGCSKLTQTDAQKHDRMVAYTSTLPHAAAVALVNADDTPTDALVPFIGGGLRDATRVADINVKLWSELFMENGKNLTDNIDNFINELQKLRDAVQTGDSAELEILLTRAAERRRLLFTPASMTQNRKQI